jgi:hypothetical protein
MLKVSLAVLPAASVAEQLTGFAPSGKVEPDTGAQTTATAPSTISEAEVEKVAIAPEGPVASSLKSVGRLRVGGVVSTTKMLKLLLVVLPLESVAEQETEVEPSGKVSPGFALQTGVIAPSTVSLAETAKLTDAPDALVASSVMSAGKTSTGAVVSCTLTVNPLVPVFP